MHRPHPRSLVAIPERRRDHCFLCPLRPLLRWVHIQLNLRSHPWSHYQSLIQARSCPCSRRTSQSSRPAKCMARGLVCLSPVSHVLLPHMNSLLDRIGVHLPRDRDPCWDAYGRCTPQDGRQGAFRSTHRLLWRPNGRRDGGTCCCCTRELATRQRASQDARPKAIKCSIPLTAIASG